MQRTGLGIALRAIGLLSFAPIAAQAAPTPPEISGFSLGTTSEKVDQQCKKIAATCTRTSKTIRGKAIQSVRANFANSDPLKSIELIESGGSVIGITATYQKVDTARYESLAKTMGPGSRSTHGRARWVGQDFVMSLSSRGGRVEILATTAAQKAGVLTASTVAKLTKPLWLTEDNAALTGISLNQLHAKKPQLAKPLTTGLKLQLPKKLSVVSGAGTLFNLSAYNPSGKPSQPTKVVITMRAGNKVIQEQKASFSAVAPKESSSHFVSLDVPVSTAAGAYALEFAWQGNKKIVPLQVLPPGPDLVITALNVPKTITEGQTVAVEMTVWNIGSKPSAGGVTTKIGIDGFSHKSTVAYVGPIGVQKKVTLKGSFKVPYGSAAPDETFRAWILPNNDVNAKNNKKTVSVKVNPAQVVEAASGNALPVSIVLTKIECLNSNEDGDGDSPLLIVRALHTAEKDAKVFEHEWSEDSWTKWWNNDESDENFATMNHDVFGGTKWVGIGESVGMHISIWETDPAGWDLEGAGTDSNDEVGFSIPHFDWDYLHEHEGQTLDLAAPLESDEGAYALHYRLTIGKSSSKATATPAFAKVAYPAWARKYELHNGAKTHKVTLTYSPSNPNNAAWHPFGTLTGKGDVTLTSERLWGNYWEFKLVETSGNLVMAPRRFVGYLVGDAANPVIAGTRFYGYTWAGDGPSGFYMTPSP